MVLSLGFSPCPNDTFIFDALVNGLIDTQGIEVRPVLEDVETLNRWALEGKLDITKLSFPAFFQTLQQNQDYILLDAGAALGKGVGPLLVSKHDILKDEVREKSLLIPGVHTTANLLLSFAYPEATNKTAILFSEIEDAVLEERAELGVLIHENRFTYAQRGLKKVADLGSIWEEKMNAPIPLGGIAIGQHMKRSTALKVNSLIAKSLDYAFSKYPEISNYVRAHAQSMSDDVMRQHIDLYVNEHSRSLGSEGRQAINTLHEVYLKQHGYTSSENASSIFLIEE